MSKASDIFSTFFPYRQTALYSLFIFQWPIIALRCLRDHFENLHFLFLNCTKIILTNLTASEHTSHLTSTPLTASVEVNEVKRSEGTPSLKRNDVHPTTGPQLDRCNDVRVYEPGRVRPSSARPLPYDCVPSGEVVDEALRRSPIIAMHALDDRRPLLNVRNLVKKLPRLCNGKSVETPRAGESEMRLRASTPLRYFGNGFLSIGSIA